MLDIRKIWRIIKSRVAQDIAKCLHDGVSLCLFCGDSSIDYFAQSVNKNTQHFTFFHVGEGVRYLTIYDRVQAACKEKGITVSALEDKLKFTRSYLYKWNNHVPAADKVAAVAKELGKPIEYFLQDAEKERSD